VEVETVPKTDVMVYSGSFTKVRAVAAAACVEASIAVDCSVCRYRHTTAVAFATERSCGVVCEVERDDRHALVLSIYTQEVHKGNRR
jgi:hypothetical protein